MIPIVALVGRSNVGKSTLFNQLTRTKDALVADFAGLTRDRKYGYAKWKGYKFIVIDTGGIDGSKEIVKIHTASQSLVAIEEANIILFIVDSCDGLIAADQVIAKHLRSCRKPTVVVANKTDSMDANSVVRNFCQLGMGKIIPIAALYGRGINFLLKYVLLPLVRECVPKNDVKKTRVSFESWLDLDNNVLQDKVQDKGLQKKVTYNLQPSPITLAVVGRPNVGKSTLINHILNENRMVVYDMPGTTRDSICIPMIHDKQKYILIDTAGIRKQNKVTQLVEKFSVIKSLQAIKNANVVLLVIDAIENISDQDLSLIDLLLTIGRSLVIIVNKCDRLSSRMRKEMYEKLNQRLRFICFVRIHFISALRGIGVSRIFESVNEAYQCSIKSVSTALLTKIMLTAVDEHQPPLIRGRRVRLKYAHLGGYSPPVVVIHGNHVLHDLPDTYKRYLINYFHRTLKIMGTPILLRCNEAANPFID